MTRATCDILQNPPPPSPDESMCLAAVLMALADLLVERDVFTREQLEIRAQAMIENPDLRSATNFASAVAQRLFEKRFGARFEKQKPDTTGICPIMPGRR
jgi:hypothetical protein